MTEPSGTVEAVAWMYVRPEDEHTEFFCDRWPELVNRGWVETPVYTRATPSDQEKQISELEEALISVQPMLDEIIEREGLTEPCEVELLCGNKACEYFGCIVEAGLLPTPPAQVGAATDSGEGVRSITAAELGEIMQEEWGEICEDAQAHPSDIRREGRKLFYDPRHWTDAIARRLNERLASSTKPVADSVEAVEKEHAALVAAGFDEYAATCALRTEADGGFCHAYFYSDGQWRFQTGGGDLTLNDGSVLRCVFTKRLYASMPSTDREGLVGDMVDLLADIVATDDGAIAELEALGIEVQPESRSITERARALLTRARQMGSEGA